MRNNSGRVRFAIQKAGRLSAGSLAYLTSLGIDLQEYAGQLYYQCANAAVDLLFVRDHDIPQLIANGVCDYGIVGANVLQEFVLQASSSSNKQPQTVRRLNFGYCRLAIAMPDEFDYTDLRSLQGLKLATSYPNILNQFMQQHNIKAKIATLNGSVEIAPRLGFADGICDLVSSGATLLANELREVASVFTSQAVLIKNPQTQLEVALTC